MQTNETVRSQNSSTDRASQLSLDDENPSASNVVSARDFRMLRRNTLYAWIAGCLSIALIWGQYQKAVLHPWSFTFIALLVVTYVMGLRPFFLPSSWRLLRASSRGHALVYIMVGLMPAALWVALGWHGANEWSRRDVPGGFSGILVRMAGASLADAHARWIYPHRLEGQHLIMLYDDRVSDPRGDLRQMDDHLGRMEKLTQLQMREKVSWFRGAFHGHRFAMYGLALGSSESPSAYVDRHELAHAFLNQHTGPGPGPPMFLVEGWAEAQSKDSPSLARHALAYRTFISTWAPAWPTMSSADKEEFLQKHPDPNGTKAFLDAPPPSYLRALTNPFWSAHDAGAVYRLGGAFADFFIRHYGVSRFLELYFNTESRGFESECRRLCGIDLAMLESEFWKDVEHIVNLDNLERSKARPQKSGK